MKESYKDYLYEKIKSSPHYKNMEHLPKEKQEKFMQIISDYAYDIEKKMYEAGLVACFNAPTIKFGYVYELDENKKPTKESIETYEKLKKENKIIPL